MAKIDRTFDGATREIYRLCDRIGQLEADNKFLAEQLMAVGMERNILRKKVEQLTKLATNASWEAEALRNQIPTNHEMGQ